MPYILMWKNEYYLKLCHSCGHHWQG